MAEQFKTINLAIELAGLVLCLLGNMLAVSSRTLNNKTKRCFILFFVCLIAETVCNMAGQLMRGSEGNTYRAALYAANFGEFLFSFLMPFIGTHLLFTVIDKDRKWKKAKIYLRIYLTAAVVLLIISQFNGLFYTIDLHNIYHRSSTFYISFVLGCSVLLLDLILIIKYRGLLTKREIAAFAVPVLVPVIAIIIQIFVYGIYIKLFSEIFAALILYIFILSDQIDLYVKQCEQIAAQQASIAVLQMRPHFIYNTLTSIYYLCEQDPKKAQQVTDDFITYLRNNLSAIAKEGDIPFKDELEHAKAYLAVEQVRFEGLLYVNFDTPHTFFRVPPLTLQPLVENSVKHGLNPGLDPLYISVFTRKTDKGSVIIVEDTGIGFTAADKTTPHIALENIRSRIEIFCSGTLSIEPRKAGGTVVTIFIPDKKK